MSKKGYKIRFVTNDDIYKMERKTHPSFLRGWDVSDKTFGSSN